jgi:hypothetical protein
LRSQFSPPSVFVQMDHTNPSAAQSAECLFSGDDQVAGCCSVFPKTRRRKAHRPQIPKHREEGRRSRGRKGNEEVNHVAFGPVGTAAGVDPESQDARLPGLSSDLASKERQSQIGVAMLSLNNTITAFENTLKSNLFSPVPESLGDGIECVSAKVDKIIRNIKESNDAKDSKTGSWEAITHGLSSICQWVEPALKNFLAVSSKASAVRHYLPAAG